MSAIAVRKMTNSDRPFVASSWYESYWKGMMKGLITYELYERCQGPLIDSILDSCTTWIVHSAEVPDEIVGYAVIEGDVVHYVYVKSLYRRRGIATGLVASRAKMYSHRTKLGVPFCAELGLQFNPYAAMR